MTPLAELLEGCLAWVLERLARFDDVKRLAELATFAGALDADRPEARHLLSHAWDELGQGEAIADAVAVTPVLAIAYHPFRRAGLRSPSLERRLAEPRWRAEHASWSPLARYTVGTMLQGINVHPPWQQSKELRALRLFQPASDLPIGLDAAIAAHIVMWRTAMGSVWWALDGRDLAAFEGWLPRCTRQLLEERVLDPLAELIVANACLRRPPLLGVWEPILAAQREDGSVPPGPDFDGESFEDLYHTTLVAGLAASVDQARNAAGTPAAHPHYAD